MTTCAADAVTGNATFPVTVAPLSGTTSVNGACNTNYAGSPTRACNSTGQWSSITGTPCTRNQCPADSSVANATWPATNSPATSVAGVCFTGYSATTTPKRNCVSPSSWSTPTSTCTRMMLFFCFLEASPVQQHFFPGPFLENTCAKDTTTGNATFTATLSLTSGVSGTCATGWSGSPLRDCGANGWNNTIYGTPCTRELPMSHPSPFHLLPDLPFLQ